MIQNDGMFVCRKYDLSSSEPHSTLLEAVSNFCDDLLLKDEPKMSNFTHKFLKAIGDEGTLLSKWKLDAKKIGEQDTYENVNDLLRLLNQINADLLF